MQPKHAPVLVIGVSGLVGHAAAMRFRDAGYQVTGISRGPGEYPSVEALQESLPGITIAQGDMGCRDVASEMCPAADLIVFAGGVSGVVESFDDPVASLTGNGIPWLQTLLCSQEGTSVLLVSSQLVYGPATRKPFSEGDQCSPRSPYALHRLLMEEQGRLYADRRNLAILALRLGNVYGKVVNLDAPRAHGLVAKMLKDLVRDGNIRLYGRGTQEVDLLHVDDLAAALVVVARTCSPGFGVYNISGERMTIRQVAEALRDGVERGELVDSPWPPAIRDAVARDIVLDDRTFRDSFGWTPVRRGPQALTGIASEWAPAVLGTHKGTTYA